MPLNPVSLKPVPRGLLALLRTEGIAVPEGVDPATLDPGCAIEYRFDPQRTIRMLAERIEALHSIDPAPHRSSRMVPELTMSDVVTEARAATAATPEAPVGEQYAHMTRTELLAVLESGAERLGDPEPDDVVLTHGAPDLDALRCADGDAVGFVDWEALAMADRHRDLAHAAGALAAMMGPMAVPEFFSCFAQRPQPARLDWWLLASQLVRSSGRDRTPGLHTR